MRKGMLVVAAVALGALAVTLPAVAGSETSPTITAVNSTGIYSEQVHSWSPSAIAVGEGASVTLSNPTTVAHGVQWISSPATPACSGVPVGTSKAASGTQWSGACTFTQPGTYLFYCTVHGAAMRGTITVAPSATQTPISTLAPTTPVGTTVPGTGPGGQAGTTTTPAAAGSPFAGGVAQALKLAATQHGSAVRGTVGVSASGADGRLEIDLLASGTALSGAMHAKASNAGGAPAKRVRVGRFVRSSLVQGTVRFAVALSVRARHALERKGRLALTVEVILQAPGGSASTASHSVVMRPGGH